MAIVTQVSAESFVGGLVKPKRVRKGVLKPDKAIFKLENSDNSDNSVQNALIFSKTLENQPTITTIASTIYVMSPTK